ncbi:hypothetical protein IW262DRAFT_1466931 [Armillaria fumosa]|nr:hypothetical protein IW262DRAFT_1466931 [Armillaria fumosa]
MSLGKTHSRFIGTTTEEEAFMLLDTRKAGVKFTDIFHNYQDEQSEVWLREWMEQRENRDQLVIAAKYHMSRKEKIAKRDHTIELYADYIDILYAYNGGTTQRTSRDLMQLPDAAVRSAQVLYLGITDVPAWVVIKTNVYASFTSSHPS